MAKLIWNALISQHPNRYCLHFQFHELPKAKKVAAKRKTPIPPFRDGKILPTLTSLSLRWLKNMQKEILFQRKAVTRAALLR